MEDADEDLDFLDATVQKELSLVETGHHDSPSRKRGWSFEEFRFACECP
jgi:hypothetical protein